MGLAFFDTCMTMSLLYLHASLHATYIYLPNSLFNQPFEHDNMDNFHAKK